MGLISGYAKIDGRGYTTYNEGKKRVRPVQI